MTPADVASMSQQYPPCPSTGQGQSKDLRGAVSCVTNVHEPPYGECSYRLATLTKTDGSQLSPDM